jgi:hypothetical protein
MTRARAIALLAVSAVVGSLLILAATHWQAGFETWVRQDLRPRVLLVTWFLTFATGIPLIGFAVYIRRQSRAIAAFLAVAAVVLPLLLWRAVLLLLEGLSQSR